METNRQLTANANSSQEEASHIEEQAQVAAPVLEGRVMPPEGTSPYKQAAAGDMDKRLDMFVVETARRRLKDLIIPETTMRQLKSLLTKITYHQVLYDDFGLSEIDPYGARTAINLYGPPGTGKSFAADAIANELGMRIIRANYAEIESKYVGETPKNIKAAFEKARKTNSLLFFDEADSILGRRLTNITQSPDHAVNVSRSVMLLELDQFSGVVVFATNLASNYDAAFIRRILGHIEMPLPDADNRLRLWQYHIPSRMPVLLRNEDWDRLVSETEGLAGGDILNIVINAASVALEREGPDCKITLNDFVEAAAASKRAKREIGVSDPVFEKIAGRAGTGPEGRSTGMKPREAV